MNPILGWVLALLALVVGVQSYGLKGLALGVTLIVFWLVLQFNRSIRVMKNASSAPIGFVPSAVMLNARLKPGLSLLQIVSTTRSLGRKVSDDPECWAWTDEGGASVIVTLTKGRLVSWKLEREAEVDEVVDASPPP